MDEPIKRGRGRPNKPEGTVYVQKVFRLPPLLWREVEELAGPRERAEFVRGAIEREVRRRRKARSSND